MAVSDDEAVRRVRDHWREFAEAYAAKAHESLHREPIDYGGADLYASRAKEASAGVRAIEEVMDELGIPK